MFLLDGKEVTKLNSFPLLQSKLLRTKLVVALAVAVFSVSTIVTIYKVRPEKNTEMPHI